MIMTFLVRIMMIVIKILIMEEVVYHTNIRSRSNNCINRFSDDIRRSNDLDSNDINVYNSNSNTYIINNNNNNNY